MDRAQMNRDEFTRRLGEVLEARAEVLEAYLFGSAAPGRAQPHSDIDVAVFVDGRRCPRGSFGYSAGLTTHLITGIGCNSIDVVILNHVPPSLYHRVLRDGRQLLSRDLRTTTSREARALSRYCDFVPQLEKYEQAVARGSGIESP